MVITHFQASRNPPISLLYQYKYSDKILECQAKIQNKIEIF